MQKLNKVSFVIVSTMMLVSCFGPQTYFSEVFNLLYDNYGPSKNSNNQLDMNYQVNATVTTENSENTFEIYLFEVGIKLINVAPFQHEGGTTTRTLTMIYDYQENGLFALRSYADPSLTSEKIFAEFDDNSFNLFNRATDIVDATLTEETLSIINNQATNLVIGGQPETQDVKVYNLPVSRFVDLADFESTAGFIPSSLDFKVTFTTSTLEGSFEITATTEEKSYTALIELSRPNQILASDHLLSSADKNTYEGYLNAN